MQHDALDTIGFYITRTQSKLKKHFIQSLKPYGITPEQWVLFARLSEIEGISLTDLSKISIRDKPYTTRLIENLEAKGIIRREECQTDKRSSLIFLTEQGSELRRKISLIAAEINQWSIETLSEEEVRQLKLILNKLYNHIKD
jgi:DNA-binding MarR family transcriptional regulator